MPDITTPSDLTARLCAACGMCCDGVLFHAVELQKEDSPRQLASLGLKLRRKKGVEFFLQPCYAHRVCEGACSCAIYEERPARCSAFNCRQLLGAVAGTITEAEAMAAISTARNRVEKILALMEQIGPSNANRSLAHRVANLLTLPPNTERSPLHDELDKAMKGLEAQLEKEFRVAL